MTSVSSMTNSFALAVSQTKTRKAIEPENLASAVKLKQQQELIQTAQQAFNSKDAEQPSLLTFTGEIAKDAAIKHTKQTLVFAAIEAFKESEHRPIQDRPRIQTQA